METRADGATTPNSATIRFPGNDTLTVTSNPTDRVCIAGTSGPPTNRTSFLVNKPNVLFVNKSVAGGNQDGTSWANAFTNLQDALAAANPLCTSEIWVAQGHVLS